MEVKQMPASNKAKRGNLKTRERLPLRDKTNFVSKGQNNAMVSIQKPTSNLENLDKESEIIKRGVKTKNAVVLNDRKDQSRTRGAAGGAKISTEGLVDKPEKHNVTTLAHVSRLRTRRDSKKIVEDRKISENLTAKEQNNVDEVSNVAQGCKIGLKGNSNSKLLSIEREAVLRDIEHRSAFVSLERSIENIVKAVKDRHVSDKRRKAPQKAVKDSVKIIPDLVTQVGYDEKLNPGARLKSGKNVQKGLGDKNENSNPKMIADKREAVLRDIEHRSSFVSLERSIEKIIVEAVNNGTVSGKNNQGAIIPEENQPNKRNTTDSKTLATTATKSENNQVKTRTAKKQTKILEFVTKDATQRFLRSKKTAKDTVKTDSDGKTLPIYKQIRTSPENLLDDVYDFDSDSEEVNQKKAKRKQKQGKTSIVYDKDMDNVVEELDKKFKKTTRKRPAKKEKLIPKGSRKVIPTTSGKQIPTTQKEIPTIQKEILSTQKEIPTTSGNEIPTSFRRGIPTNCQNEFPTTSRREIPTTSRRDLPTTSQKQIPTTSRREIPTTSQKEIPTTSRSEIPTTSRSEIPTTSRKEILAPSTNEIPTTSRGEISTTSLFGEIPTMSHKEIPTTRKQVTSDKNIPVIIIDDFHEISSQDCVETSDEEPEIRNLTSNVTSPNKTFDFEEPVANSTMLNGTRNDPQASPWRSNLNVIRNPHFLRFKESFLPNYNQQMILDSSIVERTAPRTVEKARNRSPKQASILNYIDGGAIEVMAVNTTLFDDNQFSPIKEKTKENLVSGSKKNSLSESKKNSVSESVINSLSESVNSADKENSFEVKQKRRVDRAKRNILGPVVGNQQIVGNSSGILGNSSGIRENSSGILGNSPEIGRKSPGIADCFGFDDSVDVVEDRKDKPVRMDKFDAVLRTENQVVDVFDVEENSVTIEENVADKEVGLFEDYQPDRTLEYSTIRQYVVKKKRQRRCRSPSPYSDESDDEAKHHRKKRNKRTKKEEDEAEKWAAAFNSMCEEVEKFPLEIE